VLHAADTTQRMVYLLTSGFLGRLCLSGEITQLDEDQWTLVKEAIRFYGQIAPVIARGTSRVYQRINPSWQHLQGAQAVSRIAEDGQSALIVMHSLVRPQSAVYN
jgi:alpha-galactosidase